MPLGAGSARARLEKALLVSSVLLVLIVELLNTELKLLSTASVWNVTSCRPGEGRGLHAVLLSFGVLA
jgi:hypothetical protein